MRINPCFPSPAAFTSWIYLPTGCCLSPYHRAGAIRLLCLGPPHPLCLPPSKQAEIGGCGSAFKSNLCS